MKATLLGGGIVARIHSACLLTSVGVVGIVPTFSHAAPAEPSSVGVSLEMPVLNVMRSHTDDLGDRSGLRVGPWIDEADYGPQVLGLLGLVFAPSRRVSFGGRVGFAPTCWDGGDGGEGGRHVSWQVEPFFRYSLSGASRLRPFLEGGLLLARTCTGNTFDQSIGWFVGPHAAVGGEFRAANGLSFQLAARGIGSLGTYEFLSHGEVSAPRSASDLRFGLQLGVTFWFDLPAPSSHSHTVQRWHRQD